MAGLFDSDIFRGVIEGAIIIHEIGFPVWAKVRGMYFVKSNWGKLFLQSRLTAITVNHPKRVRMQMTEKLPLNDLRVLFHQPQIAQVVLLGETRVSVRHVANVPLVRTRWYMSYNIYLSREDNQTMHQSENGNQTDVL